MDKPTNMVIDEETEKLKANLINAVNGAKMPAAVTKLVVESTAKDILMALNQAIQKERESYS